LNFYQAQDDARRSTWRLIALFVAAVLSLIVMTNLLVAVVYVWTGNHAMPTSISTATLLAQLPTEYWLTISVGVVAIVALASLFKFASLRGGGRSVAEALGGRLISPADSDTGRRRLLNVVEEMAIASGIAVPPVYVIDEPSINAFAAGFSPDDAVIGVNQGTLDHLSRNELQGVIGHEFSHILNGDTRINLNLIATLHGILFIGLVGWGILRAMGRGRRSSSSSGGAPVMALGFGLLIIGYAGSFFGNLIKAAVSRQREYLADAAAVQFTRNPDGIASALKKIGGLSFGSAMSSSAAAEASHMFFGQCQALFMNRLLSTHPPLERRIRAVDPSWNGEFTPVEADLAAMAAGQSSQSLGAQLSDHQRAVHAPDHGQAPEDVSDRVAQQVGQLHQQALDHAVAIISATESTLREAAHDPWAARGLIHAMLLDDRDDIRRTQLQHLAANTEPVVFQQVGQLADVARTLDEGQKLALVEMSMPALKELSHNQFRRFMENAITLINADARVDLFEWVLHRLLVKELHPHFEGPSRVRARYATIDKVAEPARVLLSALAREQGDAASFDAGMHALGIQGALDDQHDPNFARLNDALRELRRLKPLAKPRLIKACAAVALAGDEPNARAYALLQGISAALDCPLPPFVVSAT